MHKVNVLKLNDSDYPEALRQIPTPPKTIYYTGAAPNDWLAKPRVAVVGSRKVSPYGQQVTQKLVTELAEHGIVIISGLALGVDALAHQAALKAGAITVAVLPTDLSRIYPASHANLARQIVDRGGTLISEYDKGSDTFRTNFVARNRIVSGLADILLITEAAAASGTMHTAAFALEQGKTVMAVPGNITSENCQGTNNLIKSGAVPVTEASDVLFALGINPAAKHRKVFSGTPEERKVLAAIRQANLSQEELALELNLSAPDLALHLTSLEIGGYIRPEGGGRWAAL